jgi:hypothetical protein
MTGHLDGYGPLVDGHEATVGGVTVGGGVHLSKQVDGDPGRGDLVVGVGVAQPLEDPPDRVLVEPFPGHA